MQSHPVAPQPAPKPVSVERSAGAKAPEGFGDLVARAQASEPQKGKPAHDAAGTDGPTEKPGKEAATTGAGTKAAAKGVSAEETATVRKESAPDKNRSKETGAQAGEQRVEAAAGDAARQMRHAKQIAGAAGVLASSAGSANGDVGVSGAVPAKGVAAASQAAVEEAGAAAGRVAPSRAEAAAPAATAQADNAARAAVTKSAPQAQVSIVRDGAAKAAPQKAAAPGDNASAQAPAQAPARVQVDVSSLTARTAATESAGEPMARGEKTGARAAAGEVRLSVETTGQRAAPQVARGLNEALLTAQSQRAEPREAPLRAKARSADVREGRGLGELRMPDPMRKLEVAAKPAPQPLHGRVETGVPQNAVTSNAGPAGLAVMGSGMAGVGGSGSALPGEGGGLSGIGTASGATPGALSSNAAGAPPPSGQLAGGNLPPQTAQQAAVQVQRAFAQGQSQLRVQLTPAGLGSVDVRMEFQEDGVRVRISVERAETFDMMSKDARALERALNDAGVRTQDGGLSFDLKGGGRQHAQGQAEGADDTVADAGAETDGDLGDQTAANESRITDGAGGVDLRV